MNAATIIVLAIVAICSFFAVGKMIKNRGNGCSGGCSSCSMKDICKKSLDN